MPSKDTGRQPSLSRRDLLAGTAGIAALSAMPAVVQAQEGPIKIGFPCPLTGPYGAEAQNQVMAAQLAVQEFNDSGGLNGR